MANPGGVVVTRSCGALAAMSRRQPLLAGGGSNATVHRAASLTADYAHGPGSGVLVAAAVRGTAHGSADGRRGSTQAIRRTDVQGRFSFQRTYSAERMLAFSDAMLSIVSTLMVVPISQFEADDNVLTSEGVVNIILRALFFVANFALVYSAWMAHAVLFRDVEAVTVGTAIWNAMFLLCTSFVPLAFVLAQSFPLDALTWTIYGATGALEMLVYYGLMRSVAPLHKRLSDPWQLRYTTHHVAVFGVISVAVAVSAQLIGSPYCYMSAFLFFVNFPAPFAVKLLWSRVWPDQLARVKTGRGHKVSLADARVNSGTDGGGGGGGVGDGYGGSLNGEAAGEETGRGGIPKARIEAMTDGVYAIAATLVVLDVRIPVGSAAGATTVMVVLNEQALPLVTYALSCWMIAIGWVAHLSLTHSIRKFTMGMSLANGVMCVCVALLPFCTSFVLKHKGPASEITLAVAMATLYLVQVALYLHAANASDPVDGMPLVSVRFEPWRRPYIIARGVVPALIWLVGAGLSFYIPSIQIFPFALVTVAFVVLQVLERRAVEAAAVGRPALHHADSVPSSASFLESAGGGGVVQPLQQTFIREASTDEEWAGASAGFGMVA